MESFQVRTYGPSPCRAAVLHGGPGAIGSAAGLARGLAESCGVLEPLQSKYSVTEQVEELQPLTCRSLKRAASPTSRRRRRPDTGSCSPR